MEAPNYRIVFNGQVQPKQDLHTVRRNFARLFNITEIQLERLFSGKPVILKKGLNQTQASHYEKAIIKAGGHCIVIPPAEIPAKTHIRLEPKEEQSSANLFQKSGLRMGRSRYSAWSWGVFLASALITTILLTFQSRVLGEPNAIIHTTLFMIWAGCCIWQIVLVVPRLHDLEHSGWLSPLLAVPILNLFLMFYTTIAGGSPGINEYGNPPPKASTGIQAAGYIFPLASLALLIAAGVYYLPMVGSMIMSIMPLERP